MDKGDGRSNKEQKSPMTIWYHRLEEFESYLKKHKLGLPSRPKGV